MKEYFVRTEHLLRMSVSDYQEEIQERKEKKENKINK